MCVAHSGSQPRHATAFTCSERNCSPSRWWPRLLPYARLLSPVAGLSSKLFSCVCACALGALLLLTMSVRFLLAGLRYLAALLVEEEAALPLRPTKATARVLARCVWPLALLLREDVRRGAANRFFSTLATSVTHLPWHQCVAPSALLHWHSLTILSLQRHMAAAT